MMALVMAMLVLIAGVGVDADVDVDVDVGVGVNVDADVVVDCSGPGGCQMSVRRMEKKSHRGRTERQLRLR